MKLITEIGDRKYYFGTLDKQGLDLSFLHGQEFVLLIHIDKDQFALDEVRSLASKVLGSNARYVVCTGSAGEAVHDLFDEIISHDRWDEKRGETILTTWHDKESSEEAVSFFANSAFPERSNPKFGLMLFPAKDAHATEYVACLKKTVRID